jgi:hypothetical protein
MTTIGIIGAGAIGSAFATALANKGIEAVIANSRGPESLRELTRRAPRDWFPRWHRIWRFAKR